MAGVKREGDWTNARSAAGNRSPWLIVGVISLATFMEVLDSSIANVSLQHIAGGLSVSQDEATWVLTSYLVANAIIIPLSGWLSDVIGRKRYYMISVALFTGSSLLCGMAPSLPVLVLARVLQGIGGGGLAPSEQSFLADTFPPSQRGKAFAAYAFVVVVGPVLGPSLGGWITDNVGWHWIFLINVPIGIVSLLLVQALVAEPAVLEKERRKRLKKGLRVDYVGFALIALGLGCLEVTLDRGERDDWFASPLIAATAVIAVLSLVLLVVWELNRKDPVVNLRLWAKPNFAISSLFMFTAGVIIFGSTQLIPQFLQQVLGYDATMAGLALTTGGIATILVMPLAGALTGKVDSRMLLFPALLLQGWALLLLSRFNSQISFGDASTGRFVQALGLPFLFVPVNTSAFVGLKQSDTNQASGLLNVARNLGGSIGISVAQTLLQNRQQFHQTRIVEGLQPGNPDYVSGLDRIGQALAGAASDATTNLGVLYQQVQQQAVTLAYVDTFHVFMIFVFCIAPFALMLRQRQAGDPAGGH